MPLTKVKNSNLHDADLVALAGNDGSNLTGVSVSPSSITGVTSTAAELNHVGGVTSALQTQIDEKQAKFAKGADIASATSLTCGTDGNYFDVTGTTTITSISTVGIGAVIKLHFDDVLTLTHNATGLILPDGDDITTEADTELEFIEYAVGDWRCTSAGAARSSGTSEIVIHENYQPTLSWSKSTGGFITPHTQQRRHKDFTGCFILEKPEGFLVIDKTTKSVVNEVALGYSPVIFEKMPGGNLMIGKINSAGVVGANIDFYECTVVGSTVTIPGSPSMNIVMPYMRSGTNHTALMFLSDTKAILTFCNSNGGAYRALVAMTFGSGTVSKGAIDTDYRGVDYGLLHLGDAIIIDGDRILLGWQYNGGGSQGVSNNCKVEIAETTDGSTLSVGGTSPVSSYCRFFYTDQFDVDASRPFFKATDGSYWLDTWDSNSNTTRRSHKIVINTGTTNTNYTASGNPTTISCHDASIFKHYQGATVDSVVVVGSSTLSNSRNFAYVLYGTTSAARSTNINFGETSSAQNTLYGIQNVDKTLLTLYNQSSFDSVKSNFNVKEFNITGTGLTSGNTNFTSKPSPTDYEGSSQPLIKNGKTYVYTTYALLSSIDNWNATSNYEPFYVEGANTNGQFSKLIDDDFWIIYDTKSIKIIGVK